MFKKSVQIKISPPETYYAKTDTEVFKYHFSGKEAIHYSVIEVYGKRAGGGFGYYYSPRLKFKC